MQIHRRVRAFTTFILIIRHCATVLLTLKDMWRNKKNINTFGLKKKKTSYQELCIMTKKQKTKKKKLTKSLGLLLLE